MQKIVYQGGFAAAHFAGNDHEAFVFGDRIFEMRVGAIMAGTHIEEVGIREQVERFFPHTVKIFVHIIRAILF